MQMWLFFVKLGRKIGNTTELKWDTAHRTAVERSEIQTLSDTIIASANL